MHNYCVSLFSETRDLCERARAYVWPYTWWNRFVRSVRFYRLYTIWNQITYSSARNSNERRTHLYISLWIFHIYSKDFPLLNLICFDTNVYSKCWLHSCRDSKPLKLVTLIFEEKRIVVTFDEYRCVRKSNVIYNDYEYNIKYSMMSEKYYTKLENQCEHRNARIMIQTYFSLFFIAI